MEVGDCRRQWVEDDVEAAVGVRKMMPRGLVGKDTKGSWGTEEWEDGRTV